MNQGWLYQERIKQGNVGIAILDYYANLYQHSSRAEWHDRILSGQILVDGVRVNPELLLKKGQCLTYQRSPWQEPDVPLAFDVLHEDRDLLIVAKPSGLPVLPGGGFLEHTLLHQLRRQYPQDTPVPIHRLGRGTSGLMVLARSPLAKSHLTQQMRDRRMRKTYLALVGGGPMPDEFAIAHPIGKINHPILGYLYGATPQGKFAQSDCQVMRRDAETTLLAVKILTGRPHQIRIHLAAAGCPLIGDPLYGIGGVPRVVVDEKQPVPGDCGYFLHAWRLAFVHPRTGQEMSFVCPPPAILSMEA
jgi:23S rRNA pseudouridine1911/1915/1917 synthase